MADLSVCGKSLVNGSKPFIVAEIGSNFDQSFDKAIDLITAAKNCGADAVKFQLFKPEVLYPNRDGLYDVFKSVQLSESWLPGLINHCNSLDIAFSCSCFDLESLSYLCSLNVPFHKIASSEITNIPLLHSVASTGKPTLISTGMSQLSDIDLAVEIFLSLNNPNVVLLQCSTIYPALPSDCNINVLKSYLSAFPFPVGFSDHSESLGPSCVALAYGATVFEKHLTLDKESDGPDHSYAMEPDQFKLFVSTLNDAWASMGSSYKTLLPTERQQGRREGFYLSSNFDRGVALTDSTLVSRRPALGIRSHYSHALRGSKLKSSHLSTDPLLWSDITF